MLCKRLGDGGFHSNLPDGRGRDWASTFSWGRERRGGKLTPPLPLMKEVLMAKEKQMNLENPQTIHACGRNAALNQTVNL